MGIIGLEVNNIERRFDMGNLDYIYKRRSVRKFEREMPPKEDLMEILKAATYAPSGKNLQNWHFVVVKNKEKLNEIAEAISYKNRKLRAQIKDLGEREKFEGSLSYSTFFKNAPVCIFVFASEYPITALNFMKEVGAKEEEIKDLINSAPGIQGVSAAIENLQLAAASLGYGTCWMTGPNYAAKEIVEALEFDKEGFKLVALMPLGIPADIERVRNRKSVLEVTSFIE